ncbi:hypothetical protein Tco_1253140 [Tanacetum coccineum]
MSVFDVRSRDEESTPANDRFSKADGYHVVPSPITRNFLTPRVDISFAGLDEYTIRKKIIKSKTTELNADTSKSKTSKTVGNTNEVNVEKPKSVNESVMSTPNINKDKVIIEDWNSDDEDDVSEFSPVRTNETQTAKTQVDKIGQTSQKQGIGFKKIKAYFVCKSTDHLIKDCTFHDKQKYPHLRKTFIPSGVLTRTGLITPVKQNEKRAVHTVSTARPVSTARHVSTVRPFTPKTTQTSSAVRPIYPRMDNEIAVLSTTKEGLLAISATIDGHKQVITEASLRRHLNSKKTAWDQFSSNIATSIICLATSRMFNFSKFIFEAMVKNLDSLHKFLLYPRFIQLLLNKQQRLLLPHTRTYPTPTLTSKLFSNMRRASKGYSGVVTPLFESMLVQAHDEEKHQSPSRITSSPSLSPQPTQLSPSPEPIQPTYKAEETASMPHDLPLHAIHSRGSVEGSMQQHDLTILVNKLSDRIDGLEKDLQQTTKTYSTALTKLVLRVKKLEYKLKSGKARRKAKIVFSDDEEIIDDSSKQGRKISQIDEDLTISLVQDEGISWIPLEEEVHEKPNDETEVIIQEETPIETIEEHVSGEKGEIEISTASPPKVIKVSTAEAHVYTRRSAKDKGKAILKEPVTPKKVKKGTQVQLSMDEELARKMEKEERARFNVYQEARALQEEEEERLNLEAAWELQRQLDERQQVPTEATQSKGIDLNDPSVLRYHALKNKPVSIAQARRNMITYLKNQGGSEVEKGSSKLSKRETSKIVEEEKVEKEDVKPGPVMIEKKVVRTRRKTLTRRRASDKQVEDSSKRQKKEKESDDFEQEKEDLRMWLSVLKDKEESMTLEFLSVRYLIVN